MTLRGRMTDRPEPRHKAGHLPGLCDDANLCWYHDPRMTDRPAPALTAAHRYIGLDDVSPARSAGWSLNDWHCRCGAFGSHYWTGYAYHLEDELKTAAAAQRAVAAGEHTLKVQHNGELLAQRLIHERRMAAGDERVRALADELDWWSARFGGNAVVAEGGWSHSHFGVARRLVLDARAALAAASPERCPTCDGRGSFPRGGDPYGIHCLSCDGEGFIRPPVAAEPSEAGL